MAILLPIVLGLERVKFENKEVTFEEHIKHEHSLWHYLFFIVYIKTKESTEFTGPESYVSDMINVRENIHHNIAFLNCSFILANLLTQVRYT